MEKKKKGNKANVSTASEPPVKGIYSKQVLLRLLIFFLLTHVVEEGPARKKSSKKSIATASTPESATSFGLSTIGHSDVLDMPVDPNEPTYCLCHQVSYGEMIGCDNPDVRSRRCLFCRSFFVPSHLNPFFLTVPN